MIFIWICAATCVVQGLFPVWLFRRSWFGLALLYCTNEFRRPSFNESKPDRRARRQDFEQKAGARRSRNQKRRCVGVSASAVEEAFQ
jgi:hypothetical protein